MDDDLLYEFIIIPQADVKHHTRSIYTGLDLLGDIGGLFDALKGISSFILAIYFSVFGDPIHKFLMESIFF